MGHAGVANSLVQQGHFAVVDIVQIVDGQVIFERRFLTWFERFVGLREDEIGFRTHDELRQFKPNALRISNIEILLEASRTTGEFQPSTGGGVVFWFGVRRP